MTPDYEEYLRYVAAPLFEPWVVELTRQYRLQVAEAVEDAKKAAEAAEAAEKALQAENAKIDHPHETYFDKRIGRMAGGSPPRGKQKPPEEKVSISGDAAATLHRAMGQTGRR